MNNFVRLYGIYFVITEKKCTFEVDKGHEGALPRALAHAQTFNSLILTFNN